MTQLTLPTLPKISLPTYSLTLPASKIEVKYRGFTGKENKILLQSKDFVEKSRNGNLKPIYEAVRQIVGNCIIGDAIDFARIPLADFEYLFLAIRCKSVGEEQKIVYTCNKCNTDNTVSIDLDQATVATRPEPYPENYNIVEVGETDEGMMMSLELTELSANDYMDRVLILDGDADKAEMTKAMVVKSVRVKSKEGKDERPINMQAYPMNKRKEFIQSLPGSALEAIDAYVESLPELRKTTEFVCTGCGFSHKIKHRKGDDFFA